MSDKIVDYRAVSVKHVLDYLNRGYELYGHMAFGQDQEHHPAWMQSVVRKSRLWSDQSEPTPPDNNTTPPNPPNKTRVLLVEDNDLIVAGTCPALERLNCEVNFAATGADALKEARENHYDLIFMDVGLPDQDGIEVTRKIRALADQRKAQVAIVALSAYLAEDQKTACRKLGIKEILIKPATPLQLQAVLEKWVPTWVPRKEPTGAINASV